MQHKIKKEIRASLMATRTKETILPKLGIKNKGVSQEAEGERLGDMI